MTQFALLTGRGVIGWAALHNLLVNRDDSNIVKNGFAQGATRESAFSITWVNTTST